MGSGHEFPTHHRETTEVVKAEMLQELDDLKQVKIKLAAALNWLQGNFKIEDYKTFKEAQANLNKDERSMEKFMAFRQSIDKVAEALTRSKEIQELITIDSNKFKHFNNYCATREIKNLLNLNPFKPGQTSFNLVTYLAKISEAQVIIDNYIRNTLFFLTSTQKSIDATVQQNETKDGDDKK